VSRNRLRKRVARAFDAAALIEVCEAPHTYFSKYADYYPLGKGWKNERFYYHRDNGSDILAVAHLDYVHHNPRAHVMDTDAGPLVMSGALDDRLGAYIICELLPKLGVNLDLLLTTDEEIGDTSADAFDTDKQYNWIIEFDRGGTDVVMYQFETPALRKLVRASGAMVGTGSFSDICALGTLGVAAFNWGVGYEDYHGPRSHAWLNDTFQMVAHFMRFYTANYQTQLPYVPVASKFKYNYLGGGQRRSYRSIYDNETHFFDETDVGAEDLDFPTRCLEPECNGLLTYGVCDDCGTDWWRHSGGSFTRDTVRPVTLAEYKQQLEEMTAQ
jgi:hypothetical protein